jgi:hypothetical protein
VVENKDQHQTSSAPQQQQQQQIMSTTFMSAIPQISTGTQHLTTSTSQAANQQLEFKPSPNNVVDLNASLASSESKLGFDDQELSNDASGPAGQKPDGTKHQKMLEKYAEDEDLGDLATQAMSLYSNVNFPNLKTEIQGKHIYFNCSQHESQYSIYLYIKMWLKDIDIFTKSGANSTPR